VSAPAHKVPRSLISEAWRLLSATFSGGVRRQRLLGAVGAPSTFAAAMAPAGEARPEIRVALGPWTSAATAPLCLFVGEAQKQRERKASLAERKEGFRREARSDESLRMLADVRRCCPSVRRPDLAPPSDTDTTARATSLDTERSRTGSKSRTCVQSDTPPRASTLLSHPRRS
jgi:hypothetical protein